MGGDIYQMEIQYKNKEITPDLTPEKMKIKFENVNNLLGIDLKEKDIKKLLERMGYELNKNEVSVPAWRADVLHEVDLIEDIAIAYGYENFIPEIPKISTIGEESKRETVKRKIGEILSSIEFLELSNYHLTNKEDQFRKMGIQENKEKGFIEVENSKTDYNLLRKDLTHYMLKILSENVDVEYPHSVFEIGKVFSTEKSENGKTGEFEEENLALAISPGNFTQVKQVLEYLSRMLGINLKLEETELEVSNSWFIEGRVGKITLDNKEIGFIGEIHPKILKNWKIKMPVSLFEISLEEVYKILER
jgi:phenylalanyl-tRNA synthetase beta chain